MPAPPITMNALSWNYRGLGNQHAVNDLSNLVREKKPKIVFLMETKKTVDEMRKLKKDLHFTRGLVVPCDRSWGGRRGGLAMLWKDDVDLHIQTYSPHHIDAIIQTNPRNP